MQFERKTNLLSHTPLSAYAVMLVSHVPLLCDSDLQLSESISTSNITNASDQQNQNHIIADLKVHDSLRDKDTRGFDKPFANAVFYGSAGRLPGSEPESRGS